MVLYEEELWRRLSNPRKHYNRLLEVNSPANIFIAQHTQLADAGQR